MSDPMLPKELELDLDFGSTITDQIERAVAAQKPKYAWFRALTDEQFDRLIHRLVDLAAPRITAYMAQVSTIVTEPMFVSNPEDYAEALAGMKLTFSLDELQQCCEAVLPMATLQKQLLEELDIRHIFGDSKEDLRLAEYAAKVKSSYNRVGEVKRHDPKGELFMIDLPDLIGHTSSQTCNELDFVAFGCHGTAAASLKNREGAKQIPSLIWRGIAGNQKAVGDQVVRHMREKKRAGKKPFGFILGDNFYESGIPKVSQDVVDHIFSIAFADIYNPVEKKHGSNAQSVYFAALGNHDYNFHGHAVLPGDGSEFANNLDRALAQVDYSYGRGIFTGWVLPYRYYCVVSPVANFFVIDTSTLLFDKKQQEWLKKVYEKVGGAGRWNFLMAHHGYVTFGSRGAGHHAEKDLGKLAKTPFTKKALKDRGRTGASETEALAAAATGLRDNVNRHIFTWIVNAGLHFHFNVVAHDHFLASALLTYDLPTGDLRRTYYVLSGGGGAWPGGANLDTLVRLGPNLANIDLLEKRYGFATFNVTRDEVNLNYRIVEKNNSHDVWATPKTFRRTDAGLWAPSRTDAYHKSRVQPVLRGVFYKRGEGGLLHSYAYKRRYFEIGYETRLFRYGEKPGKFENSIQLQNMDRSSRSWASGEPARRVTVDGVEGLFELTFRTTRPNRTWVFAVPPEIYADLVVWLDS